MTTWLLLRGWAREARHWGEFPRLLAARTGSDVIALDLPGNGVRWRERSPVSVAAMVDAARAALQMRAMQAPVHVLGLSMGAMVAMEWSRRHSSELASAVLVNGSARGLGAPWERLRPGTWGALLRAACVTGYARERGVLSVCSNDVDPQLASQWAAYAEDQPTSTSNAMRQLAAAAMFRVPAHRPSAPVLVLASTADRLVSVSCSQRLAAQWQVPIRLHPSAGHDLAVDAPTWLASACASWAQDVSAHVTPLSRASSN